MQETYLSRNKKTIIALLFFIASMIAGFIVKSNLEENQWEKAQMYNTAIQAKTDHTFNYAIDSRQGNIITSGLFETNEPVSNPNVNGNFFKIIETEERYTRHTETYECGSKESPRTCTRTYYTWDHYNYETSKSPTIVFRSREYPSELFSEIYPNRLDCSQIITNKCKQDYRYEDKQNFFGFSTSDKRWKYEVIPTHFYGAFIANSQNGILEAIDTSTIRIRNNTVEEMIEKANKTVMPSIVILIWLIMTIIITITIHRQ